MRNLLYICTKGNTETITQSYNEMMKLVNDGYTAKVELETVMEEYNPTDKRKEIIIK